MNVPMAGREAATDAAASLAAGSSVRHQDLVIDRGDPRGGPGGGHRLVVLGPRAHRAHEGHPSVGRGIDGKPVRALASTVVGIRLSSISACRTSPRSSASSRFLSSSSRTSSSLWTRATPYTRQAAFPASREGEQPAGHRLGPGSSHQLICGPRSALLRLGNPWIRSGRLPGQDAQGRAAQGKDQADG